MIESPKFALCHVGKTGGDAIKQICMSLNLPDLNILSTDDPEKHQIVDPGGKDFLMSIRRLPARALSYYYQIFFMAHEENPEWNAQLKNYPGGIAGWILDNDQSETELQLHTHGGKHWPRAYIRTENLRGDLKNVLSQYYALTEQQEALIRVTKTKPKNPYKHDLSEHFSRRQMQALYKKSPLWREFERMAYGNLLMDL